jgi:8-amino-7-oxononanoate synthase
MLVHHPQAVIVTNILIRDYLLNYARALIYTTSLSFANVIAVDCSFDMLENGTAQDVRRLSLNPFTLILRNMPFFADEASSKAS